MAGRHPKLDFHPTSSAAAKPVAKDMRQSRPPYAHLAGRIGGKLEREAASAAACMRTVAFNAAWAYAAGSLGKHPFDAVHMTCSPLSGR